MKKINDNKIRWGIIGVGDVCEVKSAPAMQLIQDSELVAVMRRDGEKARDYARRHGVPKWYNDADQLINDPEINTIYIATPPVAHMKYTLQAAKAGKPVYVEKPMARNTQECQRMIDACHQAQVPLFIAYYRRCLPNFDKYKSLLEEGAIGEIRSVKIELFQTLEPALVSKTSEDGQLNWRLDPSISGGGYFFDLASHQLDYLDYVFGPVKSAHGNAVNQANDYAAADNVQALLSFGSGIIGLGTWCFTVDQSSSKDEMLVIGSEGQLRMAFFGDPRIYLERSNLSETRVYQFDMPSHIQYPLIQTVVDDLLGRGACPSTGETALRTNKVMEQITGQYYSKLKE
jgi:predicted dehydrogenase